MKKTLNFVGGLIASIAVIALFVALYQTLSGKSWIDSRLTESILDKIFWIFLIFGCAGFYFALAVKLFRGNKPEDKTKFIKFILIAAFVFAAGMYYHFIFNSPW